MKRQAMKQSSSRPVKKPRRSPLPAESTSRDASDAGDSRTSSSASTSDSDDDGADGSDSESIRLAQLAALAKYQQSFLASALPLLGTSSPSSKVPSHSKKGKEKAEIFPQERSLKRRKVDEMDQLFDVVSEDDADGTDEQSDSSFASGEGYDEDDGYDGFEGVSQDDRKEQSPPSLVPTVVFAPSDAWATHQGISKADRKRFMSSKSTKLMDGEEMNTTGQSKRPITDEEQEEQDNMALDKSLQHLLLTKLLPEAANPSRPVEKRNAIAGRLLELASYAPQGQGKSTLVEKSYSSQPRKLQTAILAARAERAEKARKEAEAAGSWVRGIGGLGEGAGARKDGKSRDKRGGKERERGLTMGVGKFRDGMLTLSKGEIERGSKTTGDDGPRGKKKKSRRGGARGGW